MGVLEHKPFGADAAVEKSINEHRLFTWTILEAAVLNGTEEIMVCTHALKCRYPCPDPWLCFVIDEGGWNFEEVYSQGGPEAIFWRYWKTWKVASLITAECQLTWKVVLLIMAVCQRPKTPKVLVVADHFFLQVFPLTFNQKKKKERKEKKNQVFKACFLWE